VRKKGNFLSMSSKELFFLRSSELGLQLVNLKRFLVHSCFAFSGGERGGATRLYLEENLALMAGGNSFSFFCRGTLRARTSPPESSSAGERESHLEEYLSRGKRFFLVHTKRKKWTEPSTLKERRRTSSWGHLARYENKKKKKRPQLFLRRTGSISCGNPGMKRRRKGGLKGKIFREERKGRKERAGAIFISSNLTIEKRRGGRVRQPRRILFIRKKGKHLLPRLLPCHA